MSSKFEQALKSTLLDEVSVTENGAVGYKTAGNPLLDINFSVSSLRSKGDGEIVKMFSEAFYFNPLLAIKWLFFLRDIRGGMQERRSFRVCFKWLSTIRPELVKKLIPLCAEYGRFDDLFCLITFKEDDQVQAEVIKYIDEQWAKDVENMNNKKPISLLAKWMKSCNTSSPDSVKIGKFLAKELQLSEKQYRKTLSSMRKYLNVIEQKMSAKQWSEINYEAVPSKANVKYNAAFLRNDEARRREFLGKLEKGEAKINSSANFPCDIVHAYAGKVGYNYYSRLTRCTIDPALEAMWKALPNYVKDLDTGSTIVVADGSGSMCTVVSGSMTALEVANSLAIYFSEKLNGPFKDKYITFSEHPQYVDMSNAKSLAEKICIALQHNECANTNVEAVFDLLLKTACTHQLKQEDIPSNVLIVSDMEFDSCAQSNSGSFSTYDYNTRKYVAKQTALFEVLKKRWEAVGYKMPKLVFWNVASRSGAIPLQQNGMGVALLSGFSTAIAKIAFSSKLDPYEVLVDALNEPRYDAVENAIKYLLTK